jgi:predicted XRE-type DNA-binding protein
MKIYAVVTGDIKNFTTLDNHKREKLVIETEHLLRKMVGSENDARMFRGDSYQFIVDDIGQVLKKCIQLICWFKINSDRESAEQLGTRLSIGIGEIAYKGKSVLDSDGQAFHLSGRSFDAMDKNEIIRLTTSDEKKNSTYEIILMYINLIIKQWTISQAETIYHLLGTEDSTQAKIAGKLNVSQPAVANSLRFARWKEVEKGINFISSELEKQ